MHPLTNRNLLHQAVGLSLPVNAPAGPERLRRSVARLVGVQPPARVLDIGCGVGTLLLQTLDRSPLTHGLGIDSHHDALDLATRRARLAGVADRLQVSHTDARDVVVPADVDVAVCVGSSHAVGGLGSLLHRVPAPRLLLGEGFWVTDQPGEWQDVFGPLPAGLSGLVDVCLNAGWAVHQAEASDPWEWDTFEQQWCQAVARTGLPGARSYAAQRWHAYVTGYRGRLGFGWLWLARETG